MARRQLASGSSPYVLINDLFSGDAPAAVLSIDRVGTAGSTLSMNGGNVMAGGVVTDLANQTALTLTLSATNYVELDPSGLGTTSGIRINTSGWTAGFKRLYSIVCDSSGPSTITDFRTWGVEVDPLAEIVMASDANKTLTQAEASAAILSITSGVSLTATRNIVLPLKRKQWTVANLTSGSQSLQYIGATGTGITVANGKRAILYADGTNIVRVTADV